MLKILSFSLLGFLFFMLIQHVFVFTYLSIEMQLARIYDHTYAVLNNKQMCKNFVQEFNYVIAKFYLYPLKFKDLTVRPENPTKQTIILIHGFGRSQVDWLWFKNQFNAQVYTVNLRPALGSIEEISSNLHSDLQNILQDNHDSEITLIGHSMGGIVACYYATSAPSSPNIQRIITIGSPLHGTKLAVAVNSPNMIQLRPEAPFLEQLRKTMANNKTLELFNIATKTDNLVYPWKSPILESTKADNTLILDHESHLGLIHNLQVVQQIKQWLQIQ
jgi:triacylglycerol lipase